MNEKLVSTDYQIINREPLAMLVPPNLLVPARMDLDFYLPKFLTTVERVHNSGLPLMSLDKLRDPRRFITDGVRKHTKTESGAILIRTQNFDGTPSLNLDDCVYIDIEQHQQARKSAVRPGDLLIAVRGYLGKAAIVNAETPVANINQHIARVAVVEEKADVAYLWAFFSSPTGATLCEQQVTGTVQQGIGLSNVRDFLVPLPPRPVQTYIGDKVRLAERCRSRARELRLEASRCLDNGVGINVGDTSRITEGKRFRMYSSNPEVALVDIALVSKRLDAAAYSPVRLGLLDLLQDAKCEVQSLEDVADDVTQKRRRYQRDKHPVPYFVSILHLNDKGVIDFEGAKNHFPISSGSVCQKDDILFSGINPSQNRIAVWTKPGQALCSAEFSIYRGRQGFSPFYLSFVWRSAYCLNQLEALTRGTSSSRRRLKEEDFSELLIPVLPDDAQVLIAHNEQQASELDTRAAALVAEAKADVEALIEGRLDVAGIVAGRVVAPAWEDAG